MTTRTLTALDRNVLRRCADEPWLASEIAKDTGFAVEDVRLVLSGAEHLGLAVCDRAMWTLTDAGRAALAAREVQL